MGGVTDWRFKRCLPLGFGIRKAPGTGRGLSYGRQNYWKEGRNWIPGGETLSKRIHLSRILQRPEWVELRVKAMVLFHLGFLLGLTWSSRGIPTSPLTIHPEEPLVERGGSIRLTCSMDCPGGKVQWRGLDTDLGDVVSSHTYSALTVTNATVRAEGEKSCVGQCQGKPSQKKVELRVYSFPDTLRLASQPERLTEGQPARLSCALSHVYPPGSLTLGWFRGDERLEASVEEEEMDQAHEQLFAYRSVLEVPGVVASTAYKCQAVLEVGRRTFRQEKVVTVSLQDATEKDTLAFRRTSHVATLKPPTPAGWSSSFTAPNSNDLFRFASITSGAPTTVASALDLTAETEDPNVETSRSPGSFPPEKSPVTEMETKPLAPKATSNGSPTVTLPPATSQPSAPASQQSTLEVAPTPKEGPCHLVIKSEPSQGTTGRPLRIMCHAPMCGGPVKLQWVETPAPLSQYRLEEAEDHSTLTVDSTGVEHQGVYQCVPISSQGRTASLWVTVSYDEFSVGSIIAASTAGSLIGLVVTSCVAYRMWRTRCKHAS